MISNPVIESARRVHELFHTRGLTLSAAESCTGGLVSHSITSMPGASRYFKAAIVAYAPEIKEHILGISPETIDKYGVVSRQIASEMAEKVRILTKTDCSVSTTGNLGPDLLEGKELGLIYVAASIEGKTVSRELRLKGDRAGNKEEAAYEALKLLLELVERAH